MSKIYTTYLFLFFILESTAQFARYAGLREFPFLVSVQQKKNDQYFHICAGIIMSQERILCSAHCVRYTNLSKGLSVVAGSNRLYSKVEPTRQERVVYGITVYPKIEGFLYLDLALLKIEGYLEFDGHVKPANLPISSKWDFIKLDPLIKTCFVVGWNNSGIEDPQVKIFTDELTKVTPVRVLREDWCEKFLCHRFPSLCFREGDKNEVVCTAGKYNIDGPLVCDGIVDGVFAFDLTDPNGQKENFKAFIGSVVIDEFVRTVNSACQNVPYYFLAFCQIYFNR